MSPTSPSINTTEETTTHQSPKLSEKSAKPTGIESSPPTGSETSRSFHPEGLKFFLILEGLQIKVLLISFMICKNPEHAFAQVG